MLFRLYGPEKPFFDKTWKLPDIERRSREPQRSKHEHQTWHPHLWLSTLICSAEFVPSRQKTSRYTVTADNFIRAESDAVFIGLVAQDGFGKFFHNRELTPVDSRIVQRANRDTLYSTGVFDLDAGPVTITLPDAGKRFITMIVIDEDHYVFTVVYGAGRHTLTKAKIGTRYAVAAIAYTLNNITAKKNEDGSFTVQFGGCDGKTPNCMPITPGWNYMVRLYRPRKEIRDGTWKFPEAELVR